MISAHSRAGRLFSLLLGLAAIAFLVISLRSNWQRLGDYAWQTKPVLLVASTGILTLVLVFGVWVWSRVVRSVGDTHIPLADLERIWFLSSIARYIPGKIWQFVRAVQLASAAGLPAPVLLTSMAIHAGLSLIAAGVVGAVLCPYEALGVGTLRWIVTPAALIVATLAVHPRLLNFALGLAARMVRRDVLRWTASWPTGMTLLGLTCVSWLLYGAVFYLFVSALLPVGIEALPIFIAVSCLSFLAGYLGPLPGGIGLREVALTVLLKPFVPAGVSVLLAIATRLWTIIGESIGAGTVLLLSRRRSSSPVG
jgi:uncharacterized membrane protein YbhN (UPF0104 family)